MCIHDSQSRIVRIRVSGRPLQLQYTTVFQHNTINRHQKLLDHGVTKISFPNPLPFQIQRIGKYIYTFFLYLYVRLSTQVCTRAVVR